MQVRLCFYNRRFSCELAGQVIPSPIFDDLEEVRGYVCGILLLYTDEVSYPRYDSGIDFEQQIFDHCWFFDRDDDEMIDMADDGALFYLTYDIELATTNVVSFIRGFNHAKHIGAAYDLDTEYTGDNDFQMDPAKFKTADQLREMNI